jgi:hypothetical protein
MPRRHLKSPATFVAIFAAAQLFVFVDVSQAASAGARAVVAVDGLALRAAPGAGSRVLMRLRVLTEVIRLDRAPRAATIGGRKDRWVYVQANYCPDAKDTSAYCESVFKKGWTAESFLAFDDSFEPMIEWRAGTIEGSRGNVSWTYTIAADGSYAFDWESWRYLRKDDPCPAEQQRDRFCAETRAESGQLYRYRNVVRAGGKGELLYIDAGGALCDRMSSPDKPMCDR